MKWALRARWPRRSASSMTVLFTRRGRRRRYSATLKMNARALFSNGSSKQGGSEPMPRIAVLTVPSPHSWIVINALVKHFGPVTVIAEERESKLALIRRRMLRQGPITVIGQIGFVLFQTHLARRSGPRVNAIVAEHGLNT